LIERVEDVQDKITIQRREKNVNVGSTSSKALQEIVNHVEEIIKADCSR